MYTGYYGLHLRPFENAPDLRFLFPSRSHREILASLRYGVDHAKGFILIAGEIGTGKTTMVSALLKHLDPSYIIFNIVNPKWTFDEIIKYLAIKLNIEAEHKNTLEIMELLQSRLMNLDYLGKSVVLIIDEAHLLPESTLEEIRLLSNIEKENKKLIQIILVGQKEIYQLLEKDALKTLKQRIAINRNLAPLTKKESKNYVYHRLRIAGATSQIFRPKSLSLIWKYSRGIPRTINNICDNALLIGLAEEKLTIGSKIIKEVVRDMKAGYKQTGVRIPLTIARYGWIGVAAAIVAVLLIWSGRLNWMTGTIETPNNSTISTKIEHQPPRLRNKMNSEQKMASPKIFDHGPDPKQTNETAAPGLIRTKPSFEPEAGQTEKNSDAVVGPADFRAPLVTDRIAGEIPAVVEPVFNNIIDDNALNKKQKKIMPGETLSNIAVKEYGIVNDTILDLIHMANPEIKNINLIYPGQKVWFPQITKQDLIVGGQNGTFHIYYSSHYQFDNAQNTLRMFFKDNQKAFIMPVAQGDNLVYRVYYGFFHTRNEAEAAIERLEFKKMPYLQ